MQGEYLAGEWYMLCFYGWDLNRLFDGYLAYATRYSLGAKILFMTRLLCFDIRYPMFYSLP